MKTKELYEVYFNNNIKNFDRISANSKKEAKQKIKKFYPNDKISGILLIS